MQSSLLHVTRLPLLLRSERMLLDESGVFQRIAGGWLMLTPSNPCYWWGNTLFMDQPPRPGDERAWLRLFEQEVQARQPDARHMTFGWEGTSPGDAALFLSQGFTFFRLVTLHATLLETSFCPPADIELRVVGESDWPALFDFMLAERDPSHQVSAYRPFLNRVVKNWQRMAELDRGNGFAAFHGDRIVGSLGLFVEHEADREGRRLGRFQQVLTAFAWRSKGIGAALLGFAAHSAAVRYAPTDLVIQAEADGRPRRLYERLGFKVVASSFGLERAPPLPKTKR